MLAAAPAPRRSLTPTKPCIFRARSPPRQGQKPSRRALAEANPPKPGMPDAPKSRTPTKPYYFHNTAQPNLIKPDVFRISESPTNPHLYKEQVFSSRFARVDPVPETRRRKNHIAPAIFQKIRTRKATGPACPPVHASPRRPSLGGRMRPPSVFLSTLSPRGSWAQALRAFTSITRPARSRLEPSLAVAIRRRTPAVSLHDVVQVQE